MLARINLFTIAAFIAGAGLASSQSLSISPSCVTSLKDLLIAPDAACLNPSALLSFAIQSGQSIVGPIGTWMTGLCSIGSCSDDSLAAVVNSITTGCSAELSSLGVSGDSILQIVQEAYPTVRKIACLKDDSTNDLCVTQTISNIQAITGTLSLSNFTFADIFADVSQVMASGISNLTCTNCIKEAYTLATQEYPSIVSEASSPLQSLCGSSFVDGSQPDGISQSAVTTTFAAVTSSALSRGFYAGIATMAFMAVSSAFVFLG